MEFKMHKNMLGKVMYYASDIETVIIKAPEFAGEEFDRKLPNYIILKDDKEYHSLKLKNYITDYMKQHGYITDIQNIYNEYTPIWTGSKSLKEAKEIITEYHEEHKEE